MLALALVNVWSPTQLSGKVNLFNFKRVQKQAEEEVSKAKDKCQTNKQLLQKRKCVKQNPANFFPVAF